jgi:pre-mRNA-processing factor 19
LEQCRQELAHSLYKHDAACRVIARLIKERDQARAALGATSANVAAAVRGAAPAAEEAKLAPEVIASLEATAEKLSSTRKARTKASVAKVTAAEKLSRYSAKSTSPLPGVATSLDINVSDFNQVIVGSADGSAVVYNHATKTVVDTLKSHSKAITQVKFHPQSSDTVFTSSLDGTANVWSRRGATYAVKSTVREHKAAVSDISVSPSGDFLLTASADRSWSLYDVNAGVSRYQVTYFDSFPFVLFS